MRTPYHAVYLHIVWATWDRQSLITGDIEAALYDVIRAKCRELRCTLEAIGGTENHVHLLVRMNTSIPIGILVGEVKGASSFILSRRSDSFEEFKWQGAYGVFSVDAESLPRIRRYIACQKEHHASGDEIEKWERVFAPHDTEDREG